MMAGGMALSQHHHLIYATELTKKQNQNHKIEEQQVPLPKNCFPMVQCTKEQEEEYEEIVLDLLSNTLERMRNEKIYEVLDATWQNAGTTNGFKKFTKIQQMAQHYRVQGTIRAQMATVMNLLYPKNEDQELMERCELIYTGALDATNLYTWKEKNPNRPFQYLGIQWEAVNFSSFNQISKRDFCYLEFMGTTRDLDCQPIGFRIIHGIHLPECPSLMETHGFLRTQTTEVMIFRPSANSVHTEVIVEGSCDLSRNVPSWIMSSFLSMIATNLGKLPFEIQLRRLSSLNLVDKNEWVPNNERKNCNVCLKKFGLLTKRHHCRLCGEILCGSCILSRPVHDSNANMEVKTKFCKKCVVLVSAQDEKNSFFEPPMENFESFCALMRRKNSPRLSTVCTLDVRRSIVEQIADQNTTTRRSLGSTSVFLPSHRLQTDIDLLTDWKEVGSSSKYSHEDDVDAFIDEEIRHGTVLDFDTMIEVDTKDMLRSNMNAYGNENVCRRFSSSATATTMMSSGRVSCSNSMTGFQDVEESIHQQKVILREMISKARAMSKTPSPISPEFL